MSEDTACAARGAGPKGARKVNRKPAATTHARDRELVAIFARRSQHEVIGACAGWDQLLRRLRISLLETAPIRAFSPGSVAQGVGLPRLRQESPGLFDEI